VRNGRFFVSYVFPYFCNAMQNNAIKWRSNGGVNGGVKSNVFLSGLYRVCKWSGLRRSCDEVSPYVFLFVQAGHTTDLASIISACCFVDFTTQIWQRFNSGCLLPSHGVRVPAHRKIYVTMSHKRLGCFGVDARGGKHSTERMS